MVEPGNLAGATGAEWIGRPPHEELQRKVRPLLPSDDPFYFPPAGYQHAVPGTVLRSRDVELAFMGLIPQPVTATQLLYRTTNMYGNPEATVTTVIVPAELAPGQTCPLLSHTGTRVRTGPRHRRRRAGPEVSHVFGDTKLGSAVPTPPVLIVQAVHDYLIDVSDIDALADSYTAGGANVTYHRDLFSEHVSLHPLSAPMTLRWLTDRFAGKPLTDHRVRTTWPTIFNPMTYAGMARLAVIAAKVITGRKLSRRPL